MGDDLNREPCGHGEQNGEGHEGGARERQPALPDGSDAGSRGNYSLHAAARTRPVIIVCTDVNHKIPELSASIMSESTDEVPSDLTTEGSHRGNDPPTETGRTVRSPTGPDPASGSAQVTPALFQVMRATDGETVRIRVHPPRRVVEEADDGYSEVAQLRTPDALRETLDSLDSGDGHAVFEVHDSGEVYVEHETSLDHPWLTKPEYDVATFFRSAEAAAEYADDLRDA